MTSNIKDPAISNDAGENLTDKGLSVDVSSAQVSSSSDSLDAVTSESSPASSPTKPAIEQKEVGVSDSDCNSDPQVTTDQSPRRVSSPCLDERTTTTSAIGTEESTRGPEDEDGSAQHTDEDLTTAVSENPEDRDVLLQDDRSPIDTGRNGDEIVRVLEKSDDRTSAIDEDTNVAPPLSESKAKEDWKHQVKHWNSASPALDSLMDMVGLEAIKAKFVQINTLIHTRNQQMDLIPVDERQNLGKTMVAKLYAEFLQDVDGIAKGKKSTFISGSDFVSGSVDDRKKLLKDLRKNGGVLVIEDAHHLAPSGPTGGGTALDLILSEVKELEGKAVVVFCGYGKQMEGLSGHSPAFRSLFPVSVAFPDYKDDELHTLLVHELKLQFGGNMNVAGGLFGLFMKIIAARIGRGRERFGFGNAREVQNALSTILSRHANRLFRQTTKGSPPSPEELLSLTQEDLIGPPPSSVFDSCEPWKELEKMTGLKAVKDAVKALVHRLQINYDRELIGLPLVESSLNKLFLGNPGTGKTTVAKLYGRILAEIGILSRGDVVIKTPSDFIGDALGQSESNTRAILDSTKGKVLIIDEAYMLGGTGDRSLATTDPYRLAVIDTIVGEVQSTAVEDRCVLLLGYQDRMEAMLNDGNPALARRFPLASAFFFEDYTKDELREILQWKLDKQGFRVFEKAESVALNVLERARNRLGFGNAGEVDILLDAAKIRQHRRLQEQGSSSSEEADILMPQDIDEDPDRSKNAHEKVRVLFEDFVGSEALVRKLEEYVLDVKDMQARDEDPREEIGFNFLFCGPPGSGKTTTARRMGEVFYEMGLLSTKDVHEKSATDLIGEYVGHTGPKTQKVFESALGRVLFIDEAYKLGDGTYGKEAVTEMVNTMTKKRYRNKLVLILAGYEHEINKLMATNSGLTSRFPDVIKFHHLSGEHCVELLFKCLKSKPRALDISSLQNSVDVKNVLKVYFQKLAKLPSWGNARDVQTLSKVIRSRMRSINRESPSPIALEHIAITEIMAMSEQREQRAALATADLKDERSLFRTNSIFEDPENTTHASAPRFHHRMSIDINKKTKPNPAELEVAKPVMKMVEKEPEDEEIPGGEKSEAGDEEDKVPRDAGVTDETWGQLQLDKQAARQRQAELAKLRKLITLMSKEAGSGDANDERRRLMLEKTRKALKEKEDAAREDEEMQERLREMELCPLGFKWIRQEGPKEYRCAGGSHFATFEEILTGRVDANDDPYDDPCFGSWGSIN